MSFTTEKESPDRPAEDYDARVVYIGDTRGLWVRRMNNGDHQLWIDGELTMDWGAGPSSGPQIPAHLAVAVIREAYERGMKKGALDNASRMRNALGLELGVKP